jgi:hypothetical protein
VHAMLIITTLASIAFAAAMAWLAWRMARDERRRSDARVAALAASLEASDLPLDPVGEHSAASELEHEMDQEAPGPSGPVDAGRHDGMFSAVAHEESSGGRRLAAVALAIGVVVAGITIAWTTTRVLAPDAATEVAAPPLELLSLTSARRGQELVVAGLVRNPRTGSRVERVTAVVLFFDERGGFLAASRAPLDFQTLAPGEESPFQLTLIAPEGTSRYRVSFRRAEGGMMPHVDRRAARGATASAHARQAGF